MSEELKACGCRGKLPVDIFPLPTGLSRPKIGRYWGQCLNCGARGPARSTEAEAITAWNTRAGEKG
ncbi:Lar family restriction alleviation protein [Acetobacter cerevisiae]|uniref:Restriction alleviation protein, Lar family n=1 Tax=Acetobacter cerevisiae TaxID=178900 RepID=A0A149QVW8_9PROT|nr:hypothetical protein AD928_01540 [Acetobacter cerevisiae]